MKVLDITTLQTAGKNPRVQPSMRTIEVHSEPEGGKYCLHVHHRSQYTIMGPAPQDQLYFYQFGPGATFFNDDDLLELLLANEDFTRQVDLGELDLTDGKGYKILETDTGQFVIDTKLQGNIRNQAIPVAQMGGLRPLQDGSKYYKGNNTSGLSKQSTITARYSAERHITPSIQSNDWLNVPEPGSPRWQQMVQLIGRS